MADNEDQPQEEEQTTRGLGEQFVELAALGEEQLGERPEIDDLWERDFQSARGYFRTGTYSDDISRKSTPTFAQFVDPIFQSREQVNPFTVVRPSTMSDASRHHFLTRTADELEALLATPEGKAMIFQGDPEFVGPMNFTEIELLSLETGIMPQNLDLIQANQALWDERSPIITELQWQLENNRTRFEQNKIYLQLLEDYGDDIGIENLNGVMLGSNLVLDDRRLSVLAAEMYQWAELNGEDFSTQLGRDEFVGRFIKRSYELAADQEREQEGKDIGVIGGLESILLGVADFATGPLYSAEGNPFNRGIIGGLGGVFDPGDRLARAIGETLIEKPLLLFAKDPAGYRQYLSTGQNVFTSLGSDPGTWNYDLGSGTLDAGIIIGFDYLNLVAPLSSGIRNARRVADAADVGLRTALRRSIPFSGRESIGVGWKGAKGPVARFTYSLFSRTINDLAETPKAVEKWDRIHVLVQGENASAAIAREFPELKQNLDALMPYFRGAADGAEIGDIWKTFAHGDLDAPATAARAAIDDELSNAYNAVDEIIDTSLADGTLGLQDVAGTHGIRTDFHIRGNPDDFARIVPGYLGDGAAVHTVKSQVTPKLLSLSNTDPASLIGALRNVKNKTTRELIAVIQGGSIEDVVRYVEQLPPRQLQQLKQTVQNIGFDGLVIGDRILLTQPMRSKLIAGLDQATDAFGSKLGRPLMREQKATWARTQLNSRAGEIWYVDTALPGQRTILTRAADSIEAGLGKLPDHWLTNPLRSRFSWARRGLPESIDYFDTAAGSDAIRAHGARLGASVDVVDGWVARYLDTAPEARAAVVGEIQREWVEFAADFRVKHQLLTFLSGGGTEYFVDDLGESVFRGSSKSRSGLANKPHRPTLLARSAPAPNAEWYRENARLQRFRARGKQIKDFDQRGWTHTSKKRLALAQKYGDELNAKGIDWAAEGITHADLYNMAAATIRNVKGYGNGLGAISWAAQATAKMWVPLQRTFNLITLASRFVTWPLKVVLGEEQARAQLVGLVNIYGSPYKRIQYLLDQLALKAIERDEGILAVARQTVNQQVVDPLRAAVDNGIAADELVEMAKELVPEFSQQLDELLAAGVSSTQDVLRTVRGELKNSFNAFNYNVGRVSFADEITGALNRTSKARQRLLDRYGAVGGTLTRSDMDGIVGRSLFDQVANHHRTSLGRITLSMADIENYVPAYLDDLVDEIHDPFARMALERAISAMDDGVPRSLEPLIQSTEWKRMRQTVFDILDEEGLKYVDDLDAAEKYIDVVYRQKVLQPKLQQWIDEFGERRVYAELLDNKLIIGEDQLLDLSRGGQARYDQFESWLRPRIGSPQDLKLPRQIVGERNILHINQGGYASRGWQKVRSGLQRTVRFSGGATTEAVTRRPAWLQTFKDYNNHYLSLGVDPRAAEHMAKVKATELVNELMYNLDNGSEMLHWFNRTVPFGAAMYEVSKVWLWDLPVQHLGGLGVGHIALAHKLDRFQDALVASGVAEWRETPDGGETLMLTAERDGSTLSKGLWSMFRGPELLGQHVTNLYNEIRGNDTDIRPGSRSFEFNLGKAFAPLRPLDPDNNGLFAVSGWSLGTAPPQAFALSLVAEQVAALSESRKVVAEDGESLVTMAERLGMDYLDLVSSVENVDKLLEARGVDKEALLTAIQTGEGYDDVILPAGFTLTVPNTGTAHELFDNVFFPFGRTRDPRELALSYTPNAFQSVLRSFAIHEGAWDSTDPETGGQMGGVLSWLIGPTNAAGSKGSLINGLKWAQATGNYLSDQFALQDELYELEAQMIEDGVAQRDLESGELVPDENRDDQAWRDRDRKIEELKRKQDLAVEKAIAYGAQDQVSRGMLQLFIPGSPRQVRDEQERIGAFWTGRDLIEAYKTYDPEGVTDIMETIANMQALDQATALQHVIGWLKNPEQTTSEAKKAFIDTHGNELLAYLIPSRVYNGTPFVEAPTIDEYLEKVRNGTTQIVTPEVFAVRTWNTMLTWQERIAEQEKFGNDPLERAHNQITNWVEYSEHKDEFSARRRAIRLYDQEYFDGQYEAVRNLEQKRRNPDDDTHLQADLDARLGQLDIQIETLDRLIADNDLLFETDPLRSEERRTALNRELGALKDYQRQVRELKEFANYGDETDDIRGRWFESIYSPYADRRNALYDQVDAAETDWERSLAYDNLRFLENNEWESTARVGGIEFPNAVQWLVGNRSPEDQQRRVFRTLGKKVEWMSLPEIENIMALSSDRASAERYLPTNRDQFGVYQWRNDMLNRVKKWKLDGVDDNGEIFTNSDALKWNKGIEEQFIEELNLRGRSLEAEFQQMRPGQQLAVLGIMDDSLIPVLQIGEQFAQTLEAAEKPLGGNDGTTLWRLEVWPIVNEYLGSNPVAYKKLVELGSLMWDEDDPRAAAWRFITGDTRE